MALIVETGSGNPLAESYESVANADTYHARLGNTEWAALTEAEKERRLRAATEYLDLKYRSLWKGTKLTSEQALDWPRYDADDGHGYIIAGDEIPIDLKKATCEAALRATTADALLPDEEATAKNIVEERNKVGPIEESIKYVGSKAVGATYRKIDLLIAGLLVLAGRGVGQVFVERG